MKLTSNEFMDGGPNTDKYAGKTYYKFIRIFKWREFSPVMKKYAFLLFLGMKISLSLKSTLRRWIIRALNPRKLTRSVELILFNKVCFFLHLLVNEKSCICIRLKYQDKALRWLVKADYTILTIGFIKSYIVYDEFSSFAFMGKLQLILICFSDERLP